ncbi:hypothetical protein MG293_009986 [Ovis ammon polii]|uniref:Uncharacterized protein n=1 Tax=Ovis ammon polii TaxID=230172 RepID=A0AAD4YAP1_OVIAM|nr:hypothetical protein MG293_009986 [Ovis ammon polii]
MGRSKSVVFVIQAKIKELHWRLSMRQCPGIPFHSQTRKILFRKLIQQRIVIKCYEDYTIDLVKVSNDGNDDTRHERQQVMAQNEARTFRGIPEVTLHCDSEKQNDSFGFLDKLSMGLHQRAGATEIPVTGDEKIQVILPEPLAL